MGVPNSGILALAYTKELSEVHNHAVAGMQDTLAATRWTRFPHDHPLCLPPLAQRVASNVCNVRVERDDALEAHTSAAVPSCLRLIYKSPVPDGSLPGSLYVTRNILLSFLHDPELS